MFWLHCGLFVLVIAVPGFISSLADTTSKRGNACLSVSTCLPAYLPLYLPVCLPAYLPIYLSLSCLLACWDWGVLSVAGDTCGPDLTRRDRRAGETDGGSGRDRSGFFSKRPCLSVRGAECTRFDQRRKMVTR